MKAILLHNITPDELKAMIADILKTELESILNKANDTESYSVQKVSKLLGCSKLTVYNYIKKGFLPASKIGRNYIIKKIDLDNVLNEEKSLKYRR